MPRCAVLACLCLALACAAPVRDVQPTTVRALQLPDLAGHSHSIAAERGHPLLIHFGASW